MHHAELGRYTSPGSLAAAVVGRLGAVAEQRPIATRLNLLLVCVAAGGTIFQLYGMPLALNAFGAGSICLILPIMLLQPLHWGLVHEGIHARLFPNRRTNEFWARTLSLLMGLPFDCTRFGHLVHHRFPRHAFDRPDVYAGGGSYTVAWIGYRVRLFGGVYLYELVSPLIAYIPRSLGVRFMERAIPILEQGDQQIRRLYVSLVLNIGKRRRTRRAFAMTLVLYGASAWAYGAWWPVLLGTLWARGLWHSLADNVPHHDVGLDKPARARNYQVPRMARLLLMNHHLHLTHHLYPRVPWTALGAMNPSENEMPAGNYFRAVLAQAKRVFPVRSSRDM